MSLQIYSNPIIISTRPLSSSGELENRLTELGANVIKSPMIEILPKELDSDDLNVINKLSEFSWILFTSRNGVRTFFDILKREGLESDLPDRLKFAVIGQGTKNELESNGMTTSFIASKAEAKSMAEEFKPLLTPTDRILLILGELADDTLEKVLDRGDKLKRVDVYQTNKPDSIDNEVLKIIVSGEYNCILFSSPSTVKNFVELTEGLIDIKMVKGCCIGPKTATALRGHGVEPVVKVENPGINGVVEALVRTS